MSRISPRYTQSPTPSAKEDQFSKPLEIPQQPPVEPPEMELDLPGSPPPVEDILAARRAKRQAILAKYAGTASISTSVSPSPGPSSAVQPPTTSSSVFNPVSQTQRVFAMGTSVEPERPGVGQPESAFQLWSPRFI